MATVIKKTAAGTFDIVLDSSEFADEDYKNHLIPYGEIRISQKNGTDGAVDIYWNGNPDFEIELEVKSGHTVTVDTTDATDNNHLRTLLKALM